MSRLEQYQDGKFRGVPFYWDRTRTRGRRRTVLHQYPQQDVVEFEDLGAGEKRFTLDVFVIGADFLQQGNALMAALDKPGVAELVHPAYGRIDVVVEDYDIEHSTAEGGMVTFSLQLILANQVTLPAVTVNRQDATASAVSAASGAVTGQLESTYEPTGSFARESVLGTLQAGFKTAAQYVRNGYSLKDAAVAALQNSLLNPLLNGRAMLQDVINLPASISSSFNALLGGIDNASDLESLLARYGAGLSASSGSSGTSGGGGFPDADAPRNPFLGQRGQDLPAARAVQRMYVQQTAIRLAQVVVAANYISYQQALAAQQTAIDAIDSLLPEAADDVFVALQDLRANIVITLTETALDLARVTAYTSPETVPAIVLAQRLYGTAGCIEAADDIVLRNALPHPGFVPGGRVLEVLTP